MDALVPRRGGRSDSVRAPGGARLRAAIDLVVARLDPDQLILHGSAARGEMAEHSDLDFLAVCAEAPGPRSAYDHHHWNCEATGDVVDVLVASREKVESSRWIGGTVYAAALFEGRTVFSRPGVERVRTHSEFRENGTRMVKKTRFSPEKASEYVADARKRWRGAEALSTDAPELACELLQASAERSLKALVIARGLHVEHTHDLADLWAQAEAAGERISASRDENQLRDITKYAGPWSYDRPRYENPDESFRGFRLVARDLLEYAERRVPVLQGETERRRAASRGRTG